MFATSVLTTLQMQIMLYGDASGSDRCGKGGLDGWSIRRGQKALSQTWFTVCRKFQSYSPCLLLRPGLSGTIETNLVSRQPWCCWEDLLSLQKIICIILQTEGANRSIPCEEQQQQFGGVRRVKNWLKSTLTEHYLVSRRVQGLVW